MDSFHFLRPDWLWALAPAAVLGWLVFRSRSATAADGWIRHVDSHLLRHLVIDGAQQRRRLWPPVVALLIVAATIVGVAGPTWQESNAPSFDGGEPTVVVLSLAQSMNADDLRPTRLKRSVHKLRDILDRTKGDERGLIIYADTPFVAAPLTNDANVIDTMLPELSTSLMPVLGNRLDLAISEAKSMLDRAGAVSGRIVVIADDAGVNASASADAAKSAARAGYSVSVLGAGTEAGATLKTADGRAITGANGETYMTALAKADLEKVAAAGNGAFSMITAHGADLDKLLPASDMTRHAGDKQDFKADAWVDMGYWLLLAPALLMPLLFRRGLVFALGMIAFALAQPQGARASTWDDLWATPDQQGQLAFEGGDFGAAAQSFDRADWKGAAAYRAGQFDAAVRDFAGDDYNRGNALAKAGRFEDALAAYDAALANDPSDGDAQFNRDLIAKMLEEQSKQQQQDQQQQDQQQDQANGSGEQDQQHSNGGGQQDQQQAGGSEQQDQQQSEGSGQQQQDAQGQDQADAQSQQDQQAGDQSGREQSAEQAQSSGGEQDAADQTEEAANGDASEQAKEPAQQQQAQAQPEQSAGNAAEGQQAEPEMAQGNTDGQARSDSETREDRQTLTDRLSQILGQDPGPSSEPQEQIEGSVMGAHPLDQAVEQQLRRVPDDPSGLLRARIRQHYAQMRQGG